jgi:CBS domain-containing protein
MRTIRQILAGKGNVVYSVRPEDSVLDALREMATRGVGALLVLEDGKVVGVVSERDYARKVVLEGRASRDTAVREIMSSPVFTLPPDATADDGLALMTAKRIRHLPVVEAGRLLGVISIGDLVAAVISDQQNVIEQLERYVTGER